MTRILVGPHSLDAHLARSDSASVQEPLQQVWTQRGRVLCLCTVPPRKLVIRARSGQFHLAVWPGDGPRHDPECPFHCHPAEGLEELRSSTALDENVDGFVIQPGFALQRRLYQAEAPPVTPAPIDSRRARAPMGAAPRRNMPLLGLLHFLWDGARLNRWRPGWSRRYWRVARELNAMAHQGRLGDRPLDECLYIPPQFRADQVAAINAGFEAFVAPLRRSATKPAVLSGLILAQLGGMQSVTGGWRIVLKQTAESVFLTHAQHANLTRRHIRAMTVVNAPADSPTRVFGLLHVESSPKGSLRLIDAALMVTSRDYVPVDTNYEVQLVRELIRHDRSFVKPLHFGSARAEHLPDLVLLDTKPATCVEIFGANTTGYLQLKDEKIRGHRARGDAVWTWQACAGEPLPDLPAPRQRQQAALAS